MICHSTIKHGLFPPLAWLNFLCPAICSQNFIWSYWVSFAGLGNAIWYLSVSVNLSRGRKSFHVPVRDYRGLSQVCVVIVRLSRFDKSFDKLFIQAFLASLCALLFVKFWHLFRNPAALKLYNAHCGDVLHICSGITFNACGKRRNAGKWPRIKSYVYLTFGIWLLNPTR